MKGDYPCFSTRYSREQLIESFTLSQADLQFIAQFRGNVNRYGVAILLKSLQYLGYFPEQLDEVADSIKSFIAQQLNLSGNLSSQYPWQTRTRDNHFAQIRQYTGFRFPTAADKENLSDWLRRDAGYRAMTFATLLEQAIERLRGLRIELPAENELTRLVNSALNSFFADIHHQVSQRLSQTVRASCDKLLEVAEVESASIFEWAKTPAGAPGVDSLQKEITKLQTLSKVGVTKEHLTQVPLGST